MTPDPTTAGSFLRRLEPAVRPGFAGASTAPRVPLEEQRFDTLLKLVSRGEISSGRSVQLAFEPADPLEPDQLDRLASAADVAETRGARRALMLIDGRGIVLDVDRRELTSELTSRRQDTVAGLDAAVYVAGPDDAIAEPPRGPHAAIIPDFRT